MNSAIPKKRKVQSTFEIEQACKDTPKKYKKL